MSTAKSLLFSLRSFLGPALGIICFLYTIIILITGLWPFNFMPVNKVEWLINERGIRFYGPGMVFNANPNPLTAPKTVSRSAQISIEIFLRPEREPNSSLPSILTLYGCDQKDQFMLGQWKSELIIRVPTIKDESHKRYREISVSDSLRKETTNLITISSGYETTNVFIDGSLKKQFSQYVLIRAKEKPSGCLILGNSPEGTAPWYGSIFGLAIYDHMLSSRKVLEHYHAWQQGGDRLLSAEQKPIALYLFHERGGQRIQDSSSSRNNLLMPATFHPLRRTFLGFPERNQWFSRWNLIDVGINILGFVPYGFVLATWLVSRKTIPFPRAYGISLLLGFGISLFIELTQAYLPMRDSSLLDLVDNVLGTAIGAMLAQYTLPIFQNVTGGRGLSS